MTFLRARLSTRAPTMTREPFTTLRFGTGRGPPARWANRVDAMRRQWLLFTPSNPPSDSRTRSSNCGPSRPTRYPVRLVGSDPDGRTSPAGHGAGSQPPRPSGLTWRGVGPLSVRLSSPWGDPPPPGDAPARLGPRRRFQGSPDSRGPTGQRPGLCGILRFTWNVVARPRAFCAGLWSYPATSSDPVGP
jgi:hypothetical protein